jgi:hypothetical protein
MTGMTGAQLEEIPSILLADPDDRDWWFAHRLTSYSDDLKAPEASTSLQMPSIGEAPFHSTIGHLEEPSTAHGEYFDGTRESLGFDPNMSPVVNDNRSFPFYHVDQELSHPNDRRPAILDSEIIAWGEMDRGSQQRLEAWYEVNEIEVGSWADRKIRKGILDAVQPNGAGRVAVDQSNVQIVSESNIIDCRRCDTALKRKRDSRMKCHAVIVCPESCPRADWATLKCQRCSNRETQRKAGQKKKSGKKRQ